MKVTTFSINTANGKRYGLKNAKTGQVLYGATAKYKTESGAVDYAKRHGCKEALQAIITEYLSGRRLDEDTRLVLERFERKGYNGALPQHDTPERNVMEKVDGRERYEVRGIRAEEIIADVMERVGSAEGFGMSQAWDVGNALKYLLRAGRKDALVIELGKAENYLHHALTGEWLQYRMGGGEE